MAVATKTNKSTPGPGGIAAALPNSYEAERSVLGAILLNNAALTGAREILQPEDFFTSPHIHIFGHMLDMHESGEAIDLILLTERAERAGELELVGGAAYIASLADGQPKVSNIDAYAKIVKEKAVLRQLIHTTALLQQQAFEGEESAAILDQAKTKLIAIANLQPKGGLIPIQTIIDDGFERLKKIYTEGKHVTGLATGYGSLDGELAGLQPSELIILAARPSHGKSSLALNIAENVALRAHLPVAFFSLEMSRDSLLHRLLASTAQVDAQKLRTGHLSKDDWRRITESLGNVSATAPLWIDDSSCATVAEIAARSERLVRENNLALVIVDYLQLVGSSRRFHNRQEEVGDVSRGLKALAKDLKVPVLALSQLRRSQDRDEDRVPQLSDLRESGCLAGDTLIYNPTNGCSERIDAWTGRYVASMDKTYIHRMKVRKMFRTGRKTIFRLRTGANKEIRATANHRFFTPAGWRRLDELIIGSEIAITRSLPSPSSVLFSEALREKEIALLAHLIGNGCTLPRHIIQYTTPDQDLAQLVSRLASSLFGNKIAPRINKEGRKGEKTSWIQVYLPAAFQLARGKKTPIREWLDTLGVFGRRAWEKKIPERIFRQPLPSIALFLRHLWSTDGSCSVLPRKSRGRGINRCKSPEPKLCINYATTSKELADGVTALLLRFGITSRLNITASRLSARPQYIVTIATLSSLAAFCKRIGIHGTRRQYRLQRLKEALASRVIPVEKEIAWETVAQITEDGEEQVYDLTVPRTHNFVANHFIVHNSIEQDADVVLFIHRPNLYKKDASQEERDKADVVIAKQRNGPTTSLHFIFRGNITRFEEAYAGGEREAGRNAFEEDPPQGSFYDTQENS
jgi:replicative DNA helicase